MAGGGSTVHLNAYKPRDSSFHVSAGDSRLEDNEAPKRDQSSSRYTTPLL